MRVFTTFLLCFCLLAGCRQPAPQNQPKVYYDVAGYVQAQIATLSAQKPLVQKQVWLGTAQERQTTRDVNWSRELELFMQADINKPALRSSYQIRTSPDSLTHHYVLKPGEEALTVRSLTVQLDSATRQPLRISAVLRTKNGLYESERRLRLETDPAPRIRHYVVDGFQQLIFFERKTFAVNATVQ